MRAWAAMRKSSMMKEQTRLELNISSLIWENWTKRPRKKTVSRRFSVTWTTFSSSWAAFYARSPFLRCEYPWTPGWVRWCVPCACDRCFGPRWHVWYVCWSPWRWTAKCWAKNRLWRRPGSAELKKCAVRLFRTAQFNLDHLGLTIGYFSTYTVHVNDTPERNIWVPGAICFLDFRRLQEGNFFSFLWRANEEGVDVVFEQKLISVTTVAILCLVGAL